MGCGASTPAEPVYTNEEKAKLEKVLKSADEESKGVDLKKFFEQCDTDHDGTLSNKELTKALRAIGMPKMIDFDEIFKAFDNDGDGEVTYEEFEKNLDPRTRKMIEKRLTEDGVMAGLSPALDVAKIFSQIDTDGSGTLSPGELMRAMACLGFSNDFMVEMMKSIDTDGDSNISLAEWKAGLAPAVLDAMSKKLNENGLLKGLDDAGEAAGAAAEAAPAPAPAAEAPAAEAEAPAAEAE